MCDRTFPFPGREAALCSSQWVAGGLFLGAGGAEEPQKAEIGEQWCLSTKTWVRRAGPR